MGPLPASRQHKARHGSPKGPSAVRLQGLLDEEGVATLSPVEMAEMAKLTAMHQRLPVEGSYVDTRSQTGLQACVAFLNKIEELAAAMQAEQMPRAYRASFTPNYASLFPHVDARCYRVELLEASAAQYCALWVNGQRMAFTPESRLLARELQRAWLGLGSALEYWARGARHPWPASPLSRADLMRVLAVFDYAWARFEETYVRELMAMEQHARDVLVQAAEHDRLLSLLESRHSRDQGELLRRADYRQAHGRLAGLVGRMNSAANHQRKGREDLDAGVLLGAMALLQRSDSSAAQAAEVEAAEAAHAVAVGVIDSFTALRRYLREARSCVEKVDPHLRNNSELVARLADWEENWEIGGRYLQSTALCTALGRLVTQLRTAQKLVPAFASMCCSCDPEMFMILPRIMWLCFLEQPTVYSNLLRDLAPPFFTENDSAEASPSGSGAVASPEPGLELSRLAERFHGAKQALAEAAAAASSSGLMDTKRATWELLLRSAASGAGQHNEQDSTMARGLGREKRRIVEDLLLALERCSIQLQRHKPDEWNQWCAILIRCLNSSWKVPGSESGPPLT